MRSGPSDFAPSERIQSTTASSAGIWHSRRRDIPPRRTRPRTRWLDWNQIAGGNKQSGAPVSITAGSKLVQPDGVARLTFATSRTPDTRCPMASAGGWSLRKMASLIRGMWFRQAARSGLPANYSRHQDDRAVIHEVDRDFFAATLSTDGRFDPVQRRSSGHNSGSVHGHPLIRMLARKHADPRFDPPEVANILLGWQRQLDRHKLGSGKTSPAGVPIHTTTYHSRCEAG